MRESAVAIAAVMGLVGCGSSDKPAPTRRSTPAAAGAATTRTAYHPKIDAAQFSRDITNPYLPYRPGRRWVFTGLKDGVPERVDVRVTHERKTIMGIPCVVVRDIVTSNHTLVEKTADWYSQDANGNVWYFGEDTAEYKNGVVTSTHGTWEAGVDNAQPGIVVHAHPAPGPAYRQEYRPGQAEDMAKVLTTSATQRVPAGRFSNALVTLDTDPLNPDKVEHKWYARGTGMIRAKRVGSAHTEEIRLISQKG